LLIFAEESVMAASQYSPDFGAGMCETMLKSNQRLPDAICCENDMIAIGVMRCLQQNGIRVPEDVSVIGLDNIAFGTMTTPQLTTIDQCTYELGALAAELIHHHSHSPTRKHVQLLLEPQLIKRSSVK
jgi:DNA-binding LacI/PurR family transcriptional regulator